MNGVLLKIEWISFQEGGRRKPPIGNSYKAVARFEEEKDWKNNAWTIEINFMEKDEMEANQYGFARFTSDQAPEYHLRTDKQFFLMEGPKTVARAQVVLSEKMIEKVLALAV